MGSNDLRKAVAERAGRVCEYCRSQEKYSPDPFVLEHIIPTSKRGENSIDNLAYSCQGCNSFKYNHIEGVDPANGIIASLFNPRNQSWDEHFTWNDGYSEIIGLTPTGRATIERMKLNRHGVINLRKVLFRAGLHPPELQF